MRIMILLTCVTASIIHAWILMGHRFQLRSEATDKPQDRFFTSARMNAIIVFFLLYHFALTMNRASLPLTLNTFITGLILFILGTFLRLWSVSILGRLFTFEIGIRAQHQMLEKGPYRLVRHPGYTGYLVMLLGMSLIYHSLGHFVVVIAAFSALYFRMNDEEKMLLQHFGEKYRNYILRTKRLIPFIY